MLCRVHVPDSHSDVSQRFPSVHVVPFVALDQADVDVAGVHTSHALTGFAAAGA